MIHLTDESRIAPGQGEQVLRGHVRRRASHGCRSQGSIGLTLLREIEIEQHRLAVRAQEDIGRLDIAVEDAALVGMLQRLSQACDDPGSRTPAQPATSHRRRPGGRPAHRAGR